MNEPTNPETPATPTSDEATALALLDARGRQAATSLRSVVDELVARPDAEALSPGAGEAPSPSAGPDADPGPDPDVAVVGLRPAGSRGGQGRTWLIAAAVLVVTGLVAAVAMLVRAGDEEGMVTDDQPGYLLPGWMPDGWDLQDARSVQISDVPGALTGTVTVYGDPAADDPWTGPRLSVWQTVDDGFGLDERADVEQIQVGGLPATIEDRDGSIIVRAVDGDGDDVVMVMAERTERPVALAAAEAAVAGDVAGARPDGWERLASGPVSAASATGTYALDGVSLMYGGSSSTTGQVAVIEQAGDRDDAELVRLMSGDVEVVEVRGQPAYLVEGSLLQWYEPSARAVVTLMANGLDRSELLRFAEGFRASRPGEVDDLVKSHGSSGPFGRLQPGEVVVTEGRFPEGQPWRLVASDDGSDGFGLAFADGAGSSGTGVDAASGWGTLSVDVASHQMAGGSGVIGIYGAVTPQAGELVIEAPGHEPIRLELHMVEGIAGWAEKVFAAVVPTDLGPAEVVARAADGSELARVPLDVDDGGTSSGGSTGDTIPVEGEGDGDTSDMTCRTLPDGGEECSSSSSGSAAPGG